MVPDGEAFAPAATPTFIESFRLRTGTVAKLTLHRLPATTPGVWGEKGKPRGSAAGAGAFAAGLTFIESFRLRTGAVAKLTLHRRLPAFGSGALDVPHAAVAEADG